MTTLNIFEKDDQEFLLKAEKPVLLIGEHGVGKTSVLRSISTNFNLKMHELNAATMDPFVHIVGLPVTHEGKVTMTPPDALMSAEMLFIDEINRADRPSRNALMEIICDKSVNGVALPNLKLIVAAMNPPDGEYQVDALDTALDDRFLYRFNVKRDISYALNLLTDEKQKAAVRKWYSNLDAPPSPRRLTWVVETAFDGEKVNEAAVLNALDDTLYSSQSLLRMLKVEDHGPGTFTEDLLLDEQERMLTAKIVASAFANHAGEFNAGLIDKIEERFANAAWMPTPDGEMSPADAKAVYEKSTSIKEIESYFPFDIRLKLEHTGSWSERWVETNIRELRRAL